MKIIDLSLPIYTGMPVYPGDPEASVELIQTIEKDDWNMRRIQINSHDGTHVNVPNHGIVDGKDLDAFSLECFCGPAVIYDSSVGIPSGVGVIFRDQNIDADIKKQIISSKPRFVGLSNIFELDIKIEKELLKENIIIFEKLCNLELLSRSFIFYGLPLSIKGGDGSPVRAIAVID